jgi:hypothetical protein
VSLGMRAASSHLSEVCGPHYLGMLRHYPLQMRFTALSYFWLLLQLIGAVPRVTEEFSELQLAAYRHHT